MSDLFRPETADTASNNTAKNFILKSLASNEWSINRNSLFSQREFGSYRIQLDALSCVGIFPSIWTNEDVTREMPSLPHFPSQLCLYLFCYCQIREAIITNPLTVVQT